MLFYCLKILDSFREYIHEQGRFSYFVLRFYIQGRKEEIFSDIFPTPLSFLGRERDSSVYLILFHESYLISFNIS